MDTQIRDLNPNANGSFPPLPDPLPPFSDSPIPLPPFDPIFRRNLRSGCYLINYKPAGSPLVTFDGTLRVESFAFGRRASGDLYQRPIVFGPFPPIPRPPIPRPPIPIPGPNPLVRRPFFFPAPNPSEGIPILARAQYRYYLRVTQIVQRFASGNGFKLGFEMYRFTAPGTWTNEGAFTARMTWQAAPSGYPSSDEYLEGDLQNSVGTVVGRLTMGWVSQYLRKATIEIDRVAESEAPLDNGAGVNWKSVGDGIGWDIIVQESDANIVEPSGEFWSNAECHQEMLARRDASNLDAEWRYHILCVRRLDETERGIMYDNGATDSNNVPREGCAISSNWTIPTTPEWGLVQGVRFGAATMPYYRTAIHETGHAMGLYHNTIDKGFMNTTDVISSSGTTANPFPNNIQWSFAENDQKRLRHMPDIYVRPGGTPFGTDYATTPISPGDLMVEVHELSLTVSPQIDLLPLGAPVRVNLLLTNNSNVPIDAPSSLSLGSGFIKGKVTDSDDRVRTFSPLVLCVDSLPFQTLQPGESITNSLTLLRGGQGALFLTPGIHRIAVELHWDVDGIEATVTGETSVMVTPAINDDHARAAFHVLSTPDTLLTMVMGGDHLTDGIAAIQAALDNPVLRPHYAYLEAKRLAKRFGKRKANLKAVAELLDAETVMSPAEIGKAAGLVKAEGASSEHGKKVSKMLKSKIGKLNVSDDIQKSVNSL
jgi:hypothetical protein